MTTVQPYRHCRGPRGNRHPPVPPAVAPAEVWVGHHFRCRRRTCPAPQGVTTAVPTRPLIRAMEYPSTTRMLRRIRAVGVATSRPPTTHSSYSRPTGRSRPTMTRRCNPSSPNRRRAPRRLPNISSQPSSRNDSSRHSPAINEKPNANRSHRRWVSPSRYPTSLERAVHVQVGEFNPAATLLAKVRGVPAPTHPMVQAAARTLNRSISTTRTTFSTGAATKSTAAQAQTTARG